MKKKIIFILLIFLLIKPSVYAYGLYNYEISNLTLNDSTGEINMYGWGRMNAGTCKSSPGECNTKYTPNYYFNDDEKKCGENCRGIKYASGFGSSKSVNSATTTDNDYQNNTSCKSSKNGVDGTYKYELELYSTDANGSNPQFIKKLAMDENDPLRPILDLTFSSCTKANATVCSGADDYTSGCYLDVGFHFLFNLKDLIGNKGAMFKLRIISGIDSSISETFWIGIYADKYSSNLRKYIDESKVQKKIFVVANKPNMWDNPGYLNNKSFNSDTMKDNDIYDILQTQIVNNESWFKIKAKKKIGWVPASWVEPADPTNLFIKPQEEPLNNLIGCSVSNTTAGPEEIVKDICNTTSVNINRDSVKSVCSTSTNEFYSKTCSEYITTNFIASNNQFLKDKPVNYKIGLESYKYCNYEFNYNHWNDKYDYYQNELKKSNNTLERTTLIKKYMEELDSYVNDYNLMLNSNYNYEPRASIKLQSISTYSEFTFEKDNNSSRNTEALANIKSKGVCHVLLNNQKVCDYNYNGNDTNYALKFSGTFNLTNGYFLPLSGSQQINVNVMQLGENKNWQINGYCDIEVQEKNFFYRSIDISNPFNFRDDDKCGNNWCNDKFNFSQIIKNDIWSNTPKYVFYISSKDIKNISEDNNSKGISLYTGSGCEKKDDGSVYCPFLRDEKLISKTIVN